MKLLIACGNCENQGTRSILGEITPEGYFAVMRFHRGYTNIIGKDFAVVCGACNEPQYIRKEEINGTPNITYQRGQDTRIYGTIQTWSMRNVLVGGTS